MPTSSANVIEPEAAMRGPGDAKSKVCHGVNTTTVFLEPKFDTATGMANISITGKQLQHILGTAHTDFANLTSATFGDCKSNFGTPVGITLHHGDGIVSTSNRTMFIGGTASSFADGATHGVEAFHAVLTDGCSPTTCHFDQPEHAVLQQRNSNGLARCVKWANTEVTSSNFAETCMQVGKGPESRWMVPATTSAAMCPVSKAFGANRSTPGFCGNRYAGKQTLVNNQQGEPCFVVTNADFQSTAKSLAKLLRPLDTDTAAGFDINFQTTSAIDADSLYEGKPQFTCAMTLDRHTVHDVMHKDASHFASKNTAYTGTSATMAGAGKAGSTAAPMNETKMAAQVMAVKIALPNSTETAATILNADGPTVTSGAFSADLEAAMSGVNDMSVEPAVAAAPSSVTNSSSAAITAALMDGTRGATSTAMADSEDDDA